MTEKEYKGPKSFSDELRRMPIDYQRRVKWTLRIGAAWAASVFIGAGVFILSKPYMDRNRKEKIKSGELFQEIQDAEKGYSNLKRSWHKPLHNFGDNKELDPPSFLLEVIGEVLETEDKITENANIHTAAVVKTTS